MGTGDPRTAGSIDDRDRYDVAIVGCGPVGGVLATLLGQRGHRVLVLERHPSRYPLPRAVHFDHEVARILQACGLGDQLGTISEPGSEYEWRNGAGQVLLRFGGRDVGPSGWPDANMFWQPALEELIEAAAAEQPTVEVRRGTCLTGLDDRGDRVVLTVEPQHGGAPEQVEARFAIGCDGANSTVRALTGTDVTDLGFFYDWLIVDVILDEPRVFDPVNVQVCEPTRPTTVVSGGPGRRRWEFMRLPHESVADLDDEARAWDLLAPWDITPDQATLERHAVYRFQARWADAWRVGNVLLAGDAAHQMPPFAGQGMCSGLRDAANLAWKLDLVLAGRAPADLLDRYEVERAENVRTVIDVSMALGKVICVTDPDEAAARDELMAAGAASSGAQAMPSMPGVTAGVIRADDPLAGSLFIQGRIHAAPGSDVLLDEVVGAGWRLVLADRPSGWTPSRAAAEALAALDGQIVSLSDHAPVDDTYDAWFDDHAVAAVLQRPDFHLFGSVTSLDDLDALLHDLQVELARTAPTEPHPGGTP